MGRPNDDCGTDVFGKGLQFVAGRRQGSRPRPPCRCTVIKSIRGRFNSPAAMSVRSAVRQRDGQLVSAGAAAAEAALLMQRPDSRMAEPGVSVTQGRPFQRCAPEWSGQQPVTLWLAAILFDTNGAYRRAAHRLPSALTAPKAATKPRRSVMPVH